MGKDVILMLLGAWVALLPFLGFPSSWDKVLFLASGVIIISVGISIRRAKTASRVGNVNKNNAGDQHAEDIN